MPGNLHGVLARLFMRDGRDIPAVNEHILDFRIIIRRVAGANNADSKFCPCVFND